MTKAKKTVLSAIFISLGMLLPFLTGQIQYFGNMLLPMHIPVFLCSFICGWKYGLVVGFLLPLLRSLCFTMPVLYPNALAMSFELGAYGFFSGFIYGIADNKSIKSLYLSLVSSMIAGRVVWGVVQSIILGFGVDGFGLKLFLTNGFLNAVPGIVLQLIFIPAIIISIDKSGKMKPDK